MIEVLPMDNSHIEAVTAIENACFAIPWTKADFIREINENKMAVYVVAMKDGTVVGYAGMWHIVNEGHITNVAVLPEHRQDHVGSRLLEALLEIAVQREMIGVTLEVRISNLAAQKLYTKYGFKPEGFRKKYYSDTGEDAIIMWKYFPNYEGYNEINQ